VRLPDPRAAARRSRLARRWSPAGEWRADAGSGAAPRAQVAMEMIARRGMGDAGHLTRAGLHV